MPGTLHVYGVLAWREAYRDGLRVANTDCGERDPSVGSPRSQLWQEARPVHTTIVRPLTEKMCARSQSGQVNRGDDSVGIGPFFLTKLLDGLPGLRHSVSSTGEDTHTKRGKDLACPRLQTRLDGCCLKRRIRAPPVTLRLR